MKKGFSLMEIMIVISLIILLAVIALITLNPKKQIEKSQDTKRKQELAQLGKVLEDYYNDKDCYPRPSEICYNDTGVIPCNICGNDANSPDFNPYLSQLPCDPQQPIKKYLYQVDDASCPSWYRIYTTLSNTADPVIASVGCAGGCGPEPDYSYNYGVSSPNTSIGNSSAPTPTPQFVECQPEQSVYRETVQGCNVCKSNYATCKESFPDIIIYSDLSCYILCF